MILGSASSVAFTSLQVFGTIAFAVSGAIAAGKSRMDWAGVVVLATVTAVGGGTIRDIVLGELPVWWVDEWWPLLVAPAVAVTTIVVADRWGARMDRWTAVEAADALGLAVYTLVGVDVALNDKVAIGVAAVIGVVAGVSGGMLRDVLTNRRPTALRSQLYVVAAAVGACIYIALLELGVTAWIAVWLPVLVIFGVRAASIWRGWALPKFRLGTSDKQP
jgi:uncharacterized membrane protein YeiH